MAVITEERRKIFTTPFMLWILSLLILLGIGIYAMVNTLLNGLQVIQVAVFPPCEMASVFRQILKIIKTVNVLGNPEGIHPGEIIDCRCIITENLSGNFIFLQPRNHL